jgi:hypothetical protein
MHAVLGAKMASPAKSERVRDFHQFAHAAARIERDRDMLPLILRIVDIERASPGVVRQVGPVRRRRAAYQPGAERARTRNHAIYQLRFAPFGKKFREFRRRQFVTLGASDGMHDIGVAIREQALVEFGNVQ